MEKRITLAAKKNDPSAVLAIASIEKFFQESNATLKLLEPDQRPAPSDVLIYTSEKKVGGCVIGCGLVITLANGNDFGTKRLVAIDRFGKFGFKGEFTKGSLHSLLRIVEETCSSRGDYCWLWGIAPVDPSAIGSTERISAVTKKRSESNVSFIFYPDVELPSRRAGW